MRQQTLWPGDLLRLIAFVSVPAAWWVAGVASAACLFLVAGGVMAVRMLDLPTISDIGTQIILLAVAWAAVLGTYQALPWLDVPAHVIGTGVATLVVWRGLEMWEEGAGRPLGSHRPGSSMAKALWLLSLAALLSVLWEVGEWLGHRYVSDEIGVGYDDTIVDLVWGTTGGLLAAAIPTRRSP